MSITGFMESTLGTSEVFQKTINSPGSDGKKATDKAVELIKNAKHLTNEDIEAAYIAVRQITDTLTRAAMKAFDDGRTVLIYNPVPSLSVSKALPFITYKMKTGQHVTYVFMDNYITMSRDGVMTLQAPVLRDLLIGALIANGLKRNYNILASNQYLQKVLTDVYCKFFTRILNRQYSIAADKIVFDTVQYWINRFFLTKVYGANDTPENIEIIANSHFRYIDEMKYEDIKREYDNADPAQLSDLMTLLRTATPRMKALQLGTFLSEWINYYYIPAMLATDNIEYLIFMVITLLNGNNIISVAASDVVKEAKNIKSIRGELLKLI